MQYCIYLRKSRADADAEARGEGETLARHERALLDLAARLNIGISAIYREIVSGETISARPVMQQLLAEVQQGLWTGVLVIEVERLARGDTIDQGIVAQSFLISDTKIITPSKTYDPNNEFDQEYFEFGLFMSRREYKTITRRLQRGRMASVLEGKYVGSGSPYGYVRVKLEREKGYTLAPHPEQAAIVRMIFDLYTKGVTQPDGSTIRYGVSKLARHLNMLKIAPVKGDVWVTATLQDMLKNPLYTGKIRWNWRPCIKSMQDGKVVKSRPRADDSQVILIQGKHPAIVDEKTWNEAYELISINRRSPVPKGRALVNPLAGLIICSNCGRRMVRRAYTKTQGACLKCPLPGCPTVSTDIDLVEQSVLNSIKVWLDAYKSQWPDEKMPDSQLPVLRAAIGKSNTEITELQKQKDNLHDLLERGVYDDNTFRARSIAIAERIDAEQGNLKALGERLAVEERRELSVNNVIPRMERVLALYNLNSTPEDRNQLLREAVSSIRYAKTVSGRWHGDPADFSLTLFPRIDAD